MTDQKTVFESTWQNGPQFSISNFLELNNSLFHFISLYMKQLKINFWLQIVDQI